MYEVENDGFGRLKVWAFPEHSRILGANICFVHQVCISLEITKVVKRNGNHNKPSVSLSLKNDDDMTCSLLISKCIRPSGIVTLSASQ